MLGEAFVVISTIGPDRATIDADVRKATTGLHPQVPLGATPDLKAIAAALAKIQAQIDAFQEKAKIGAQADISSVMAALADLEARVQAAKPDIRIGADISGVPAAMARLQAELKAMSTGSSVFADMLDLNVPQGQLIKQLNLLRRLVQQSDLSDMLGVNLNTSQLKEQLEKVADLSETVDVGANTESANAAIEALRARIDAASGGLAILRVGADTKEAEAAVLALQARLEKLRAQSTKLIITGDPSMLEAQIAKLEASLARLRQEGSDLVFKANTTGATAQIARLEKQVSDLYARWDKLDEAGAPDVDITAVTTKILALEAQLQVLKSSAEAIKFAADNKAINASITATEAKIEALKEQAASVKLGSLDTAGLLAAQAGITGIEAAMARMAPATAEATTLWGGLNKTLATTGVGWTATIGGIAGWHIVLDAAIEAAIILAGSVLALGAAAAAVYPAIDQLGYGINHSLQAMTALGTDAGPLAGKLDQLQRSVVPQVYEALGGALQLVTGQAGVLAKTAHEVVTMFDDWIARIDIWAGHQRSMDGLLQGGVGYLSQLGKFFGILAQAINNLLAKDPGIAHYFLDIFQGIALLLEGFSKLPAPIVETVLALHGIYIWGSVLGGILLKVATGIGHLVGVLAGLATDPLFWVVAAAAAVSYLSYQLTQASTYAKSFNAALEAGLASDTASQAITQISSDIGKLNEQIGEVPNRLNNVQDAADRAFTAGGKALEQGIGAFTKGNIASATGNWLKMLGDVGKGFADTATGILHFTQTGNDVAQFRGEITKLTGEQNNLFEATGKLIDKNNHLGTGALSVSQAFALMDMAGVQSSDSFELIMQKVTNLIHGYQAMSIQGGLLANTINAMNFQTAQQDSKVQAVNSAWDNFFSTVTGGVSGFDSFATQSMGLYSSLGDAAAKLSVSNGKASIALQATTAAANTGKASMTGLNTASLQLRDSFVQTATSANTQMDNLTTLASAAGLGARGTALLTQANKDMVAQMLPAAKGSQQMTDILYALAQHGGYQGADSFKALATWVGKTKDPMTDLDKITTTLTTDSANLAKDVQNLSIALGQTLNSAMAAAVLQATGGQKVFDNFANSILHTQFNSQQDQNSSLALAQSLLALTGNVADAHSEFDAFAQKSLKLNQDQADQLWNEIKGKLNPAISDLTNTTVPQARSAFDDWAKNGLDLSKSKADDLWNELNSKLNPKINELINSSVPGAKKAFIDWAENSLKLTQGQASNLYTELQTLQNYINGMHGTNLNVLMNGKGQFTVAGINAITGNQAPGVQLAAGGIINLGSGPTADDVLALVSRGEYVIRASSVAKYGKPLLDQLNAGKLAEGGPVSKLARYATGGVVADPYSGNLTTTYLGDMYNTFQADMTNTMVADMRTAMKSAEAAAKAAASGGYSGPGGGAPGANAALARQLYPAWGSGSEWTAWNNVAMAESGWNQFADNPSSNAYGIPQALPYTKMPRAAWPASAGGSSNPTAQITWMISYIKSVYGDPIGAWAHEQADHWYAEGGLIPALASGGMIPALASGGTTAAANWVKNVKARQKAELHGYQDFEAAWKESLRVAKKGSWTSGHRSGLTSELGTLTRRQAREEAIYDGVLKSPTKADLSKWDTSLKDLITTLKDQDLSYKGGHPSQLAALRTDISALENITAKPVPAGVAALASPGTAPKSWLSNTDRTALYNAATAESAAFWALYDSKLPKGTAKKYQTQLAAWDKVLRAQQLKTFGMTAGTRGWWGGGPGLFQQLMNSFNSPKTPPNWNAFSSALSYMIKEVEGTGIKGGINPPGTPANSGWVPYHFFNSAWRKLLDALNTVAADLKPVEPWNPGNLGPSHTVGGGVLTFDQGGLLPPGLSMTWNGTGRHELVTPAGAGQTGGGTHIHLHTHGPVGSQAELEAWLLKSVRKVVRVQGGGNAQRAFGRH